ncbi:transporter substrate-binding domain-containing protein [Lutispora thermophila]|uniref:histidine kinase n=1 Tax=Lutispora thermophila DSM 19022 TaxID=1122184 RepID=A0A1M6BTV0_9FIRM|nr:transporter substrate-binding domain-containing protein [Lutispora thermophila]SHI51974.1 polar amino acid transport system substrate-binding protein [Lutispora thermophila DSM 19022]
MGKRRIIIYILATIVAVFMVVLCISEYRLSTKEYSNTVVKVAGDNNFPPYEWLDHNNNYTGFNVDIMRAVALATGIEIEFYPMSWDEACEKLKNGEVDIIQGMKYSRERDMYYDFSDEYLENSQSIFVLAANDDIRNFKDLNGKRIALQRGDAAISTLYGLRHYTSVYAENQEEAIHSLMQGKADAFIGNTLTGVFLIDKMGIRDEIKIVGKTLNPTIYSMAVKEGNTKLLDIVNKGIKEIKRNGTYDIIYRKWFGRTVSYPTWQIRKYVMLTIAVTLVFAVVMILFLRWNSMLKKEVDKRTEQIKLEKDFREKLLNRIFSGVVTINEDNIITFANEPAVKILDMEHDKLIGSDYRQTYIKDLFSRDELSGKSVDKEIQINDRKVFINYKAQLIHNIDGNEEIILIFRDITEEKLIQENIITKDKMQSLGNLITGIAHEIRNPLTAIKAYAELIPKKIDDAKFRDMISKDIPQEIERLDKLVRDLLEYSKPRKPFMEEINLYEAVDNALLLLKKHIEEKAIKMEIDIERNITVVFDRNHIQQILINILLNAVESMNKNEKRIAIQAEERRNYVNLCIKDNGCGIDKSILNRIFNPFFTTKASGTGLGLYVSYQLLLQNNGNITVDTEEGEGTTFTITFNKAGDDIYAEAAYCR